MNLLAAHEWSAIMSQVTSESTFAVAVIDGLLVPEAARDLRLQLVDDDGWTVLDWEPEFQDLADNYLHNARPRCPSIAPLAAELQSTMAPMLEELEFVSHWAISCSANLGIRVHADNAAYVVSVWLTPDEHNLEPGRGGLTFFDVRRGPELCYPDFVLHDLCVAYIGERTRGQCMQVPYRYNRAVIFDARIMHGSQSIRFAGADRLSHRLNLSLAFDDPFKLARRIRSDGSTP